MSPALPYICFVSGIGAFLLCRYFPTLTLSLLLLLLSILFRNYGRQAAVYAAVVLAAFGYAWLRDVPAHVKPPEVRAPGEEPRAFSGVVSGLPVSSRSGYIQEIRLRHPRTGLKSLLSTGSPLEPGTVLQGFAYMRISQPRRNPGGRFTEPALFLKTEGSLLLSRADSIRWFPQRMRWRLYRYFQEEFSPGAAALLSAVVIGHRGGGDRGLYDAYAGAGLAHLMSISGTHFGLFTLLCFFLVRRAAGRLPYGWLVRLTGRLSLDEAAALFTAPLVLLYLMLSGGRIPAVRSFLMINVFLLGLLTGRRGWWLNSLLFAASVILLIDPASLKAVSFQLSFLAVFFIGITLEAFEGHIEGAGPVAQRFLRLLLVTSGALIGTSPLVLYYFHTIPTLGLPANLVFTPLVCFSILPAGVFGSMIYLATGYFPLKGLLQGMAEVVNSSVAAVSGIDYAAVSIGAFPAPLLIFVYAAAYLALKRRRAWFLVSASALTAAALLSFATAGGSLPRVTFLDVAQGDAAVVETSDGRTVVVDTGYTGREVVDFLRYRGVREVDAVVITHSDSDHSGGLWNLLRSFRVREVWDNGRIEYSPQLGRTVRRRRLEAGAVLRSGGAEFLVLHPPRGYYAEDNDSSLVLRFQDRGLSVLFTGDIEADAEEVLLGLGSRLASDVLKVAHHGSATSSTTPFVSLVRPRAAVISVGAGNPYGHPHRAALRRLSGIDLFRTDLSGAVGVSTAEAGGVVVKRFADFRLKRVEGLGMREEFENLRRSVLLW
ncbi:MAG TPA: DNA internalization-related competence protein ComEC/Rec2 [Nitrospirae bacterium]|nr:DNA internalization-related competence protein ComEC/Rec2 [Nitrospirota bacterium]